MTHNCKDCKKRYPGCHDRCESYQAYKKQREEINKNRQLEKLNGVKYSTSRKKDMIDAHRKNF